MLKTTILPFSNPLLVRNFLVGVSGVVDCYGAEKSTLSAVDRRTGDVAWETLVYSSKTTPLRMGEKLALIAPGSCDLRFLDPASGKPSRCFKLPKKPEVRRGLPSLNLTELGSCFYTVPFGKTRQLVSARVVDQELEELGRLKEPLGIRVLLGELMIYRHPSSPIVTIVDHTLEKSQKIAGGAIAALGEQLWVASYSGGRDVISHYTHFKDSTPDSVYPFSGIVQKIAKVFKDGTLLIEAFPQGLLFFNPDWKSPVQVVSKSCDSYWCGDDRRVYVLDQCDMSVTLYTNGEKLGTTLIDETASTIEHVFKSTVFLSA